MQAMSMVFRFWNLVW